MWGFDCEFIAKPGERPDVLCAAGCELWSGRSFALWEDQLDQLPSFGANALVLNFVANAECACLLSRGRPLPAHILDLSVEFRNITNGRLVPEGKGLLGALAYYGLDSIDAKLKDDMRKRIMRGRPFMPEEKLGILKYNLGDASDLLRLLPPMLPHIDLRQALYRGEFVGCLARMEHLGVPIDMNIFPSLADERTWGEMRDSVVPVVDAQYGVYARAADGQWHFNHERFAAYLERDGLLAGWPLTETGKLALDGKTWDEQSKGRPQLENLRQLRYIRDKMRKIKLAVGTDGRNRTVLWPFKAKTSRTQPSASQWIFSPAVWTRSMIKPAEEQAVAYVDYSSKEFGIAARLSDGHCSMRNPMWELYAVDPYLGFAQRVGTAPRWATKATHGDLRERLKVGLLAIQYGASPETLAGRLGISLFEAHQMLGQHRELFAQYWKWSDDWLARALNTGHMWTCFGWQCRTGITEFNERSIRNWPIQATGAEILRIAIILGTRHGIELLAPVHDAVLIQAPIERIETDVARMQQIMARASRIVLNPAVGGTHELRTDAKIIRYPDRYSDPRGIKIWDWVLERLAEQRAAAATKKETA